LPLGRCAAETDQVFTKPTVDLVAPGTLPVSEGKAKRVIDNRTR
jgi:phenylacetate-coenzyme A ligase PaaK-like adenylate-forming protein